MKSLEEIVEYMKEDGEEINIVSVLKRGIDEQIAEISRARSITAQNITDKLKKAENTEYSNFKDISDLYCEIGTYHMERVAEDLITANLYKVRESIEIIEKYLEEHGDQATD